MRSHELRWSNDRAFCLVLIQLRSAGISFEIRGRRSFLLGTRKAMARLYPADGTHFKITKHDLESGTRFFIYIWDVNLEPRYFILNKADALRILGAKPLATKSWRESGTYNWSSSTGLPKKRRALMEMFFEARWDWLASQTC